MIAVWLIATHNSAILASLARVIRVATINLLSAKGQFPDFDQTLCVNTNYYFCHKKEHNALKSHKAH